MVQLEGKKRNRSKEITTRHQNKDQNQQTRSKQSCQHGLHKDGVLDLPQRGLLDPDLAVKDLADNVALLVLDDPGLILVAVAAAERVKRPLAHAAAVLAHHLNVALVRLEQLPRPHVPVVHAVEHHTHALVRRHQRRHPEHPADGAQGPIATPGRGQGQHYRGRQSDHDQGHAQGPREEDTRRVAVADAPADEVGVRLPPERVLHRPGHGTECAGVCRVGESVHQDVALARGEVELSGGVLDNVVCNDAVDLFAEGLDGD